MPDERWGEPVKALVVLPPGARADSVGVGAFARAPISGCNVPKSIDFVASQPRNPAGEMLRRELREPYCAGRSHNVN